MGCCREHYDHACLSVCSAARSHTCWTDALVFAIVYTMYSCTIRTMDFRCPYPQLLGVSYSSSCENAGMKSSLKCSVVTFGGQGQPMEVDRSRTHRTGLVICHNCGESRHLA